LCGQLFSSVQWKRRQDDSQHERSACLHHQGEEQRDRMRCDLFGSIPCSAHTPSQENETLTYLSEALAPSILLHGLSVACHGVESAEIIPHCGIKNSVPSGTSLAHMIIHLEIEWNARHFETACLGFCSAIDSFTMELNWTLQGGSRLSTRAGRLTQSHVLVCSRKIADLDFGRNLELE
jgi:hypothetical protein